MPIPWDDQVTASIDSDDERIILAEGPLKLVVDLLVTRPQQEHARIMLSFSDRQVPPFRYGGEQIVPLAANLQRDRLSGRR